MSGSTSDAQAGPRGRAGPAARPEGGRSWGRKDFHSEMVRMFRDSVPLEVIELFKAEYCGLCCIKFSGEKFSWKHYTGRGHAGLLQRRTYRNRPLPWQMIFHALIAAEPEGASREQIQHFIQETFAQHLGGREVRRMVDATLVDMVQRFQNVVNVDDGYSSVYKLRDRSPSDRPNPIPSGCDREERRRHTADRSFREGREAGPREEREAKEWREGREVREGKENLRERRGSHREERERRRDSYRREERRSLGGRGGHRSRSPPRPLPQDRDCKTLLRTPDDTPPRHEALPSCRLPLLPRHLAFGPVGSRRPAACQPAPVPQDQGWRPSFPWSGTPGAQGFWPGV